VGVSAVFTPLPVRHMTRDTLSRPHGTGERRAGGWLNGRPRCAPWCFDGDHSGVCVSYIDTLLPPVAALTIVTPPHRSCCSVRLVCHARLICTIIASTARLSSH